MCPCIASPSKGVPFLYLQPHSRPFYCLVHCAQGTANKVWVPILWKAERTISGNCDLKNLFIYEKCRLGRKYSCRGWLLFREILFSLWNEIMHEFEKLFLLQPWWSATENIKCSEDVTSSKYSFLCFIFYLYSDLKSAPLLVACKPRHIFNR